MKAWKAVAIGWMVMGAGASARAEDASGTLKSRGVDVEIVDAYAFRGPSARDGEPVWIVALSNHPFVDDRVDRYYDRRYVLANYFRTDWNAVVFLELEDDGTCRGISYSFGDDDKCDFCPADRAESKIAIVGGRIFGWVRWQQPGLSFDATLEVTASTASHGDPLPEGGGAPGAAYLAFHRSLRSRDEVSLRMVFSDAVNTAWSKAQEAGQGESYLESWVEDHAAEVSKIEGWSQGDRALLLVEGERGGQAIHAEVLLVREGGSWRVDDEMIRAAN